MDYEAYEAQRGNCTLGWWRAADDLHRMAKLGLYQGNVNDCKSLPDSVASLFTIAPAVRSIFGVNMVFHQFRSLCLIVQLTSQTFRNHAVAPALRTTLSLRRFTVS